MRGCLAFEMEGRCVENKTTLNSLELWGEEKLKRPIYVAGMDRNQVLAAWPYHAMLRQRCILHQGRHYWASSIFYQSRSMLGGSVPVGGVAASFFVSAFGFGVPDLGVLGFWPPPPNNILPIMSKSGLPPCFGMRIPNQISPMFASASPHSSSISFRCTV